MLSDSFLKHWKLYISYILPTIVIMCINGAYNIVDSIFIGKSIGYMGLVAFSAIAPVIMLINTGLSALLNSGTAVKISQSIGRGDIRSANQYFGTMVFLDIVVCFLISGAAFLSLGNVLPLFQLQPQELIYAQQYLSVVILGSVISVLSCTMALTLKNYNHPSFSMILISISFILNIILDYFMVPTMGMFGAAISTIISQALLLILDIFVFYYILKYQYNLKKYGITPNFKKIKDILITGFPSFGQPLSVFLILFLHNLVLSRYYNSVLLSSYACITGIISIGIMVISGITHGLRPLLARSYGHKNQTQLLNILKFGILLLIITGSLIIMLILSFANVIPILYGLSGNITKVTTVGLILSSIVFVPIGFVKILYVYFQSINKPAVAAIISYIGATIILPLSLVCLNTIFGVPGIWISMPVVYFIISFLIFLQMVLNKRKNGKYLITNIESQK